MKPLVALLASLLLAARVLAADFHEHLGIQLYSLRELAKKDLPAALDLIKGYGLTQIETWNVPNTPAAMLAEGLKARGLQAVSAHMSYEAFKKDPAAVIRDAQALGVKYVIIPIVPRAKEGFKEADARRVAAEFNAFGEACRAAGLRFGYHPHGFEFTPTGTEGEVVFDVLARETKPELVCFEMDVFWAFHAGMDPVKLLRKYSGRWVLMHVKDIRKGAPTGLSTGGAPPTDKVPVGTGQIDWPAVLRTAREVGVQHYFIEDESLLPEQYIPESLKYLRGLKL